MVNAAIIRVLRVGLRIEEREATNLIWQARGRVSTSTGYALIIAGTWDVGRDWWVRREDCLSKSPTIGFQIGKGRTCWNEGIRRSSASSKFDSVISEREERLVAPDWAVDLASELIANVLGARRKRI